MFFLSKFNFSARQGAIKRQFAVGNDGQLCEPPSKRQRTRLKNNGNEDSIENELFEELKDFFKQTTSESMQEEEEDFDVDDLIKKIENNDSSPMKANIRIVERDTCIKKSSDNIKNKSKLNRCARISQMLSRNVFEIDETLSNILQFLNIAKLIAFRRINERFYDLLNFCFSINMIVDYISIMILNLPKK